MINKQEEKKILGYYKEFFHNIALARIEMYKRCNFDIRQIYPNIQQDSEEFIRLQQFYKMSWQQSMRLTNNVWTTAFLEIRENLHNALHEMRIKKKESTSPYEVKAYQDSINILKEVLTKIPRTTISL